jgi:hypothetical protein
VYTRGKMRPPAATRLNVDFGLGLPARPGLLVPTFDSLGLFLRRYVTQHTILGYADPHLGDSLHHFERVGGCISGTATCFHQRRSAEIFREYCFNSTTKIGVGLVAGWFYRCSVRCCTLAIWRDVDACPHSAPDS